MKSYAQIQSSLSEYFGGDELAPDVFLKYVLRDENDKILETHPDELHLRLAKEFARIESMYPNPMSEEEIFDLLRDFKKVVPQGSPMSGIGNKHQLQSFSNCFVVDSPHDSYGGIMFTDQEQVQIMKRRGGVGFDISPIRPRGMITTNAARTTDGIGVFMERFSNSTREVAQGGRRGALMLTIDCAHPEIETFIDIKRNLKKVTGANVSIRWRDEFMIAVKEDKEFILRWPVNCNPEDAKITKTVRAREIWDAFIDAAWASAEPGALFWDTVIRKSIADCYADVGYETLSVNPCAELPLSRYDSCRLLVTNLMSFIKNAFLPNAEFDFVEFEKVAKKAQRLMDDLVELEREAVEKILNKIENDNQPFYVKKTEIDLWTKIKHATQGGRRTGLGITGLGDALAALGVKYGSDESVKITEKIYKSLAVSAHLSSLTLASERGPFPFFDYNKEKDHEYLNKIMDACQEVDNNAKNMWRTTGRRNIALTTTAPVGSVSIITQTTSGIEPAFLLSYKRRRKITHGDLEARVDFVDPMGDKWQEYTVYHHWFKKWMEVTGKTDVTESPYWGATANDIDWMKSVEIQAAAQRWCDHGISKTANLPNFATRETVNEVYMKAWESGCKGFTVYRDGCRAGVLIQNEESAPVLKNEKTTDDRDTPKRLKTLECDIHRATVKNGDKSESWIVFVGMNEGSPYEVFCGIPEKIDLPKRYKSGSLIKNVKKQGNATYDLLIPASETKGSDHLVQDVVSMFDNPTQGAFTRTISLALRHKVPLQYVVEQLQKDKNSDMFSFAKVIARVLKGYIKDGTKSSEKGCANCGNAQLTYQEGCLSCQSCGNSKCS
jgi:ribonucleoside-diphosphate reductase alpha chain